MADRYAVPGDNSVWSETASWSTTDGGAGGASVPTASDDVFLTANTGSFDIDINAECLSFDSTGLTELTGTGSLTVHGSFVVDPFTQWTKTGGIFCVGSGSVNIGPGISDNLTFNSSGTYSLAATIWGSGTFTVTHLGGTLNLNEQTIYCDTFQSTGSTVRTLYLSTGTIGPITWTVSGSNLTLDAGTSTIDFAGIGTFNGGGKTYYNLTMSGFLVEATFNGLNTWQDFTFGDTCIIYFNDKQTADEFHPGAGAWYLTGNLESANNLTVTGCTITNSAASGGGIFDAIDESNTDGTGNTGWRFTAVAPGPPTSLVATVASPTSVSVAFTAPVDDGGSAITGYTVTSSPGGLTGTGASSPITVTGLTTGQAYTFTAVATNSVDDSEASEASNSVTPTAGNKSNFLLLGLGG